MVSFTSHDFVNDVLNICSVESDVYDYSVTFILLAYCQFVMLRLFVFFLFMSTMCSNTVVP